MQARKEYKTIFDKIESGLGKHLFNHLDFSVKKNGASVEPSICSRYMQKESDAQKILVKVQAKLRTARLEKNDNGAACICIDDVDSLVAHLDFGISPLDYVRPIVMPTYKRDVAPKYTGFMDSVSSKDSSSNEDSSEDDSEQTSMVTPP